MTDWAARVLDEVDAGAGAAVARLGELVRVPSLGGADAEHEIQADARDRAGRGPASRSTTGRCRWTSCSPSRTSPGSRWSAPRRGGWSAGCRDAATGRSLMLNGHVDVVPTGDLAAWSRPDPFSGQVVDGEPARARRLRHEGAAWSRRSSLWRPSAGPASRCAATCCSPACPARRTAASGPTPRCAAAGGPTPAWSPSRPACDLVPANAGALTFRLTVHGPGHARVAAHRGGQRAREAAARAGRARPARGAAQRRRRPADGPVADRLPALDRHRPRRRLGLDRAGPAGGRGPARRGARRAGRARPGARSRTAVAEACADDPWLREHPVEVTWWGGQFASGRLPGGQRPAAAAARRPPRPRAAASRRPGAGRTAATSGCSPARASRPCTTGPGTSALAHAADERVPVDEVLHCARTLALLALDICGVA